MASKNNKTNVRFSKKTSNGNDVSKRGNTVTVSLSKKTWIAILVILLVVAIVLVTLYFTMPDLFKLGKGNLPPNELLGDQAEVHVLDVGQGDCIIARFPAKDAKPGVNIIVDAGGTTTKAGEKPKEKIISYAKGIGITTFDHLLLTHTDADHSDFLDEVIKNFEIKNIYLPDIIASYQEPDDTKEQDGKVPTKVYYEVVKAASEETYTSAEGKQVPATIHKNLDFFKIDGANFKVNNFAFSAEHYKLITYGKAEEINSVSPISIVEFGARKVVLTGDATKESEANFIKMAVDSIDADVLKVGHHGSSTSTSQEFLDFIDPEYALISCGVNNSYGHPHKEVSDSLTNYRDTKADDDYNGIKETYVTNKVGDIVVKIGEENGGLVVETPNSEKAAPAASIGKTPFTYFVQEEKESLFAA